MTDAQTIEPNSDTTDANVAPVSGNIAYTATEAPADSAESKITVDAENILHSGEREARHGLSHLEKEFVAEFQKLAAYTEAEAKKLLAWIASKV